MTTGRDAIYLQVEVGAISASADLGRLVGISEDAALAGVIRFWHACIRDNRRIAEFQHVSRATLATLSMSSFGKTVEPEKLELLGFIRKADETGDVWRVRGLSRYVEMERKRAETDAARSLGGETRALKSKRVGGKFTSSPPADHQLTTSSPPADHQLTTRLDGRRETGDVRQETEKIKAPRAKKQRAIPSERPRDELSDKLIKAFADDTNQASYIPNDPDWAALASLRRTATGEDICTRWQRGLKNRHTGAFPGISTWKQLLARWNDLAVEPARFAPGKVNPNAPVPPNQNHVDKDLTNEF